MGRILCRCIVGYGPLRVQSKQHLSLKLFLFLLFFPFPFLSLFSDIFLPRTSRIRSKNTWRGKRGLKLQNCHNNKSLNLKVSLQSCQVRLNVTAVLVSERCTLSTLALVLADVSTYCTAHSSAFPRASSTDTCRRSSRSDLFPTTSRGILSSSAFTRKICSLPEQEKWHVRMLQFGSAEKEDICVFLSALLKSVTCNVGHFILWNSLKCLPNNNTTFHWFPHLFFL